MSDVRRLLLELYKLWYGLRFFQRTNSKGWYVIAAYHHPDSITWRWSFSYSARERATRVWPMFGPGYSMGKTYRSPNGEFSGWLRLPFTGALSVNTQAHMWRLKGTEHE